MPKRKAPKSLDLGRHEAATYQDGRGEGEFHHLQQHHNHHQSHYDHTAEDTYNLVSPPGNRARLVHGPSSYGPPRPDSVQLPSIVSVLSYGVMQPLSTPLQATRDPNFLSPRIQPLEYRHSSSNRHSYSTVPSPDSYYLGQPLPPGGGGGPRWDGYESSPQSAHVDSAYALSNQGEPGYHHRSPPYHAQQQQPSLPPALSSNTSLATIAAVPERPLSCGHNVPPSPGYPHEQQQVSPHHNYGPEHE